MMSENNGEDLFPSDSASGDASFFDQVGIGHAVAPPMVPPIHHQEPPAPPSILSVLEGLDSHLKGSESAADAGVTNATLRKDEELPGSLPLSPAHMDAVAEIPLHHDATIPPPPVVAETSSQFQGTPTPPPPPQLVNDIQAGSSQHSMSSQMSELNLHGYPEPSTQAMVSEVFYQHQAAWMNSGAAPVVDQSSPMAQRPPLPPPTSASAMAHSPANHTPVHQHTPIAPPPPPTSLFPTPVQQHQQQQQQGLFGDSGNDESAFFDNLSSGGQPPAFHVQPQPQPQLARAASTSILQPPPATAMLPPPQPQSDGLFGSGDDDADASFFNSLGAGGAPPPMSLPPSVVNAPQQHQQWAPPPQHSVPPMPQPQPQIPQRSTPQQSHQTPTWGTSSHRSLAPSPTPVHSADNLFGGSGAQDDEAFFDHLGSAPPSHQYQQIPPSQSRPPVSSVPQQQQSYATTQHQYPQQYQQSQPAPPPPYAHQPSYAQPTPDPFGGQSDQDSAFFDNLGGQPQQPAPYTQQPQYPPQQQHYHQPSPQMRPSAAALGPASTMPSPKLGPTSASAPSPRLGPSAPSPRIPPSMPPQSMPSPMRGVPTLVHSQSQYQAQAAPNGFEVGSPFPTSSEADEFDSLGAAYQQQQQQYHQVPPQGYQHSHGQSAYHTPQQQAYGSLTPTPNQPAGQLLPSTAPPASNHLHQPAFSQTAHHHSSQPQYPEGYQAPYSHQQPPQQPGGYHQSYDAPRPAETYDQYYQQQQQGGYPPASGYGSQQPQQPYGGYPTQGGYAMPPQDPRSSSGYGGYPPQQQPQQPTMHQGYQGYDQQYQYGQPQGSYQSYHDPSRGGYQPMGGQNSAPPQAQAYDYYGNPIPLGHVPPHGHHHHQQQQQQHGPHGAYQQQPPARQDPAPELRVHPVVCFGFGGKLIVTFPTPYAQSLSPQTQTQRAGSMATPLGANRVQMHDVGTLLDGTRHVSSLKRFPGPLSSGTSKDAVAKYMSDEEREGESEVHLGNVSSYKLVWELLKILCAEYGSLSGTGSKSSAIKSMQKLLAENTEQDEGTWMSDAKGPVLLAQRATEADMQRGIVEVQRLLMSGKRDEACALAIQYELWPHAILLSSFMDRATYDRVVTDFARSVFSDGAPLRTLFYLFGTRGDSLSKLAASSANPHAGVEQLCMQWQENLAMILANRTSGSERAIGELGDLVWRHQGLVDAAHLCYLLAELPFEPFMRSARRATAEDDASSQPRMVLISGDHRRSKRAFIRPDTIHRTEIFEYAKMRGNPQFVMPSVQVYKLIHATWLAEIGFVGSAQDYCNSIISAVKATAASPAYAPFYSPRFLSTLEELHQRLEHLPAGADRAVRAKTRAITGGTSSGSSGGGGGGLSGWLFSKLVREDSIAGFSDTPSQKQPQSAAPAPVEPSKQKQPAADHPKPDDATTTPSKASSPPQQEGDGHKSALLSFVGGIFKRKAKNEVNLGEGNGFMWDEATQSWRMPGQTAAPVAAPPPPPTTFPGSAPASSAPLSGPPPPPPTSSSGIPSPSTPATLPPMTPGVNQFSARSLGPGARARYVDTFNAGKAAAPPPGAASAAPPAPQSAVPPPVSADPRAQFMMFQQSLGSSLPSMDSIDDSTPSSESALQPTLRQSAPTPQPAQIPPPPAPTSTPPGYPPMQQQSYAPAPESFAPAAHPNTPPPPTMPPQSYPPTQGWQQPPQGQPQGYSNYYAAPQGPQGGYPAHPPQTPPQTNFGQAPPQWSSQPPPTQGGVPPPPMMGHYSR